MIYFDFLVIFLSSICVWWWWSIQWHRFYIIIILCIARICSVEFFLAYGNKLCLSLTSHHKYYMKYMYVHCRVLHHRFYKNVELIYTYTQKKSYKNIRSTRKIMRFSFKDRKIVFSCCIFFPNNKIMRDDFEILEPIYISW